MRPLEIRIVEGYDWGSVNATDEDREAYESECRDRLSALYNSCSVEWETNPNHLGRIKVYAYRDGTPVDHQEHEWIRASAREVSIDVWENGDFWVSGSPLGNEVSP